MPLLFLSQCTILMQVYLKPATLLILMEIKHLLLQHLYNLNLLLYLLSPPMQLLRLHLLQHQFLLLPLKLLLLITIHLSSLINLKRLRLTLSLLLNHNQLTMFPNRSLNPYTLNQYITLQVFNSHLSTLLKTLFLRSQHQLSKHLQMIHFQCSDNRLL